MKRALVRGTLSSSAMIAILAFAPGANAQSLGDLARSERERRQLEAKKPKKIYTNDDFRSATSTVPEAPNPPEPIANQKELSTKADKDKLEKRWRMRLAAARARLRNAEQEAWQTKIETVFVGGGGIPGMTRGAAVPVQMQVREFVETEALRQARKALDDLEEELRHAGLPPDWGRE